MRFTFTTIIALLPCLFLGVNAQAGTDDGSTPLQLPGDLVNGATSPVGQLIQSILLGTTLATSDSAKPKPAGKLCAANPCCTWYDVSTELTQMFKGPTGRCNDNARAAIRLGFHDAGTWAISLANAGQDFGGADGSFILFNEQTRSENNGLQDIAAKMKVLGKKYKVGYGDLIQFAAKHATVTCPLGPRIRAFVGRKDATQPSPNGLLPGVNDPADKLIALFADKGINAHDLTGLVGAHTASKQFHVDPRQAGSPQDSSPGIWDVRFYNETLNKNIPKRVFKFNSDVVLSGDARCSGEWNMFIDDQAHWNKDFSASYLRLSLAGVNNINTGLTECTDALPPAITSFPGSNTHVLGNFLDG